MSRIVAVAALLLARILGGAVACRADTLADAWRLALANNPQLAAVQLEEAASHQDVGVATTGRWPTAWAQGSYSLRSDERNFLIANPFAPGQQFVAPYAQREAAGAALGVSLPIYSGGEITNSVMSAQAGAAASVQGTASSRLGLLLAVGEAYLAVLRSQRELEVADQSLMSLVAHERDVQRQLEQQRVALSDKLAAQVAAATAEQLRLRRVNQLETARGEYNRLLSRPLGAPVQLDEISLPPLAGSVELLQQLAWEGRPDLAQLQATADARHFEAARLRGASLPHVNAVGRYDFEENRFQTPQAISTAAIVVDWNYFDAGRSRRAASAEQTRAASIAKLVEDLRSRIALEVRSQCNAAQEAFARQEVAARAFAHADESLRVSELRFAQGATVESEVLDAQARRTQAASDFYNAGYDLTLAALRLRYAVGILGNER
jgi:outer membrane protein